VGFVPLSPDMMYMFMVDTPPAGADLHIAADKLAEEFRARLAPYPPGPVATARELITDAAKVVYRPFETIMVAPPWHRGRIVLLGDAAHAMTAHIAQGAAMVMEDAVVLGEELVGQADVESALQRYTERRYQRCKQFLDMSLQICIWDRTHSPNADIEGVTRQSFMLAAQPI
jgi:2-polyprenyl-6-methoxyphenol hydroxylase-like FAD-dependent oxidoreductase